MGKEKKPSIDGPVYDARTLGTPKMLVLGLQHMFAMFGATVLVPALTGLDVATTLLFAGLGTLLFHLLTKRQVPAFLGSSFAYLAGYWAIAPNGEANLLPYACFAVAVSGLMYVILAGVIKTVGVNKVMRFFPPIVTGPIIIAIGLILSSSAINNCSANWLVAIVAIIVVIVCNMWGKGMIKIIPVLISLIVSYIVAIIMGAVSFDGVSAAGWFGLPNFHLPKFNADCIVAGLAVAVAAMVEHVGDVMAIGATTGINYIADPGLTRTLLGDGIGTSLAGLLGGPANTTYSENTGVVALTRVFDPFVMRIAAVMAIILSLSPKFEAVINSIPTAVIGGISFVLYGMIAATGIRTIVENQVDFVNMRNVLVAAIIMVSGLGFNTYPIHVGGVQFGGLACAAVFGIILNAILPGKDYEFKE